MNQRSPSKILFAWWSRHCKRKRGRSLTTLTNFCLLLTTYPSLVDIGERIPFLRKNLHAVDLFHTTYLSRFVNIVKERPQSPKIALETWELCRPRISCRPTKPKVIPRKSCGGLFLQNRIWDLGWFGLVSKTFNFLRLQLCDSTNVHLVHKIPFKMFWLLSASKP